MGSCSIIGSPIWKYSTHVGRHIVLQKKSTYLKVGKHWINFSAAQSCQPTNKIAQAAPLKTAFKEYAP